MTLDALVVDRGQFAEVLELAERALFHVAGKGSIRLGPDEVVNGNGNGVARR